VVAKISTENQNQTHPSNIDWSILDDIFVKNDFENRTEYWPEAVQSTVLPTEYKPIVKNFDWAIFKVTKNSSKTFTLTKLKRPFFIRPLLTKRKHQMC
jgi:hypothetical protein